MIATLATGSGQSLGTSYVARPRGFTLIELLVVLTIMVILSSLFPLALEHMIPARKLAAASQQLAMTLRTLQSIAMATGKTVSLVPGGNSYAIRDGNGAEKLIELPANVSLRLEDDVGGRALADLTLFPDGSSTGGRFDLQYEDRHRSVVVTHLMGRVRDGG